MAGQARRNSNLAGMRMDGTGAEYLAEHDDEGCQRPRLPQDLGPEGFWALWESGDWRRMAIPGCHFLLRAPQWSVKKPPYHSRPRSVVSNLEAGLPSPITTGCRQEHRVDRPQDVDLCGYPAMGHGLTLAVPASCAETGHAQRLL